MIERPRITYANVIISLVAFVVVFGGGAYAGSQLAKNSVGTKQLKRDAVTGAKVKDGSLAGRDLAPGVIPGVPGPPAAHQASGSVNFDSFSSSPYGSTVVNLELPPGDYSATATAQIDTVNDVASSILCRLINTGPGDQTATQRSQSVRTDGGADNLTLTRLFAVTAGQSLQLQCSKTNASSGARVNAANIVAVGVGPISGASD